jgi:SRSO17 transposase
MFDDLMGGSGPVPPGRAAAAARAFVLALLADLPRKNCWTIAEHAGVRPGRDAAPAGGACRDADGVRDELRGYVVAHLGAPGAVLVVDEAGDLKKGTCNAGFSGKTPGLRAG